MRLSRVSCPGQDSDLVLYFPVLGSGALQFRIEYVLVISSSHGLGQGLIRPGSEFTGTINTIT